LDSVHEYEEKVHPCIDLIDSLRALGVEKVLVFPAIAMIGDQSSGKSSVLEALSGVALSRGSGIVTRCPLEVKLKKIHVTEGWKGKIKYKEVQELDYPSEVEKEIKNAQDLMAGKGVGISQELISLEISSPYVPDLTLIDLPGIAKIIKHIKTYITKQETINSVVVSSNIDIATTEALKMANEVDPDGERTLDTFTEIAVKHFDNFLALHRAAKSGIEDLKQKQEAAAENMIQTQFKMERIVYRQDRLYSGDLEEPQLRKTLNMVFVNCRIPFCIFSCTSFPLDFKPMNSLLFSSGTGNRLTIQIPLIICSYVLQDYGETLQNATLQLLQDKNQFNILLKEWKDMSSDRINLRESIKHLREAQQCLAKFSISSSHA
uniref:MX dynamin like GTPase 1 n=1 Tax=Crocodylus porosus TaxID=8502 RepID=A0A7M4G1D9_CROPO